MTKPTHLSLALPSPRLLPCRYDIQEISRSESRAHDSTPYARRKFQACLQCRNDGQMFVLVNRLRLRTYEVSARPDPIQVLYIVLSKQTRYYGASQFQVLPLSSNSVGELRCVGPVHPLIATAFNAASQAARAPSIPLGLAKIHRVIRRRRY